MKCLTVTLDVWKWQGTVFVGGKPEEFKAWAKKHLDADLECGTHSAGHAYIEYGKPWVIWIEALTNVPALAHEALHVAAGILEARGLKYNEGSEEAWTYTMEHILQQVLDAKKWQKVKP